MYTRNEKRFLPHLTFEFEGVTYQGNIAAFPEAMERAGITEIPDVPRPDVSDDTHFVFPIDEAPWWSVTEKPVEMVAATLLARTLQQRKAAYVEESDPLMYDYLQEKIEKKVWLDKVAEIKLRYPK